MHAVSLPRWGGDRRCVQPWVIDVIRKVDLEVLRAFEAEVAKVIPGFQVRFKDTSALQRVLGFLSYPFNPKYMTNYTTTLGKTVWFPSRTFYEAQPVSNFGVLAHELVHLHDERRFGAALVLGIGFPQILTVIPTVVFLAVAGTPALVTCVTLLLGVLLSLVAARLSLVLFWSTLAATFIGVGTHAVMSTGWLALLLLVSLLLLAPWPSPSRTHFELRGYAMQLAITQWMTNQVPPSMRESVIGHFVGPHYYFMSWDRNGVARRVDEYVRLVQDGTLAKEAPYDTVHSFLRDRGLLASSVEHSDIYVVGR